MKIRIGNKVFDSEKKPIALMLSDEEKMLIENQKENEFVIYPDSKYWDYDKG